VAQLSVGDGSGFCCSYCPVNCVVMHEEKTMSSATNSEKADLEQPKTPQHSDNKASKMPDRPDDARKQGPNDKPGKKPGEGEPEVG
jgi:formate hydrogenlyase subunit 6/NADH:ubiquinone oxidoreductase subunit I